MLSNPDPGNNANYQPVTGGSYTIGSTYYRTEVGDFENSDSPYGTFDQGGNVWELDEAVIPGLYDPLLLFRGIRGGSFNSDVGSEYAGSRAGPPRRMKVPAVGPMDSARLKCRSR